MVAFGKIFKEDTHRDTLVPRFGICCRLESELKIIIFPTKAFLREINDFLAEIAHSEFEIHSCNKLATLIESAPVAGV